MTALADLLDHLEGEGMALLWSGVLAFLRCGAAMALAPAFGEQVIPMRIRLALSLALTLAVAPAIAAPVAPGAIALMAEALNGLLLGAGFRLFVLALQTAGMIAAQAVSMSHLFASAGAEPQSAFSAILVLAGLSLACATGLHVKLVEALIASHAVLPQGQFPNAEALTGWGVAGVSRCFALAFALAAPFVIAATLYNFALGAINRAMPTLMVVLVGAPALTFGGLTLLALTAPMMLQLWLGAFDRFLADPFTLAR